MRSAWRTWVQLWDHREAPHSLALIRILLGLVVCWDLFWIGWLDLVVPLMATPDVGGFSPALARPRPPLWFQWTPHTVESAWLLYGLLLGSAIGWTTGTFTRLSMLVFVLCSAQFEQILPNASRAIDTLIRNVLLILLFSESHRVASVDSWLRAKWGGSSLAPTIPAWPRHLIVLQLVIMYFLAGIQKFGVTWMPMGHFSALYLILQDATMAVRRFDFLAQPPWYQLTQVSTAITLLWEWSTPILLWSFWCRHTHDRPGRLRAWTLRFQPHLWWAGVGVIFHILIAATLQLGIFPWAMLALYVAFIHPNQLPATLTRSRPS